MFTYRQSSCAIQKIRVGEHDGDVRFLTGSRNMAISRMRNEKKYANWPILVAESPKFVHLMGNLGRATRWQRQIFDSRNMAVLRMRNEKNIQFGPNI